MDYETYEQASERRELSITIDKTSFSENFEEHFIKAGFKIKAEESASVVSISAHIIMFW